MWYGIRHTGGAPAVGFALRRTTGNAVHRNRCKRIIRHCLGAWSLPEGAALLCMVRKDVKLIGLSRQQLTREMASFGEQRHGSRTWPQF